MDLENNLTTEDYNNIPVYYCPHCLSLKIKVFNEYVSYCDDCGCTDIETAHIDEWRAMYKKRFGKDYT
jgi:hypothetical protein